jgi:hypothetical protein
MKYEKQAQQSKPVPRDTDPRECVFKFTSLRVTGLANALPLSFHRYSHLKPSSGQPSSGVVNGETCSYSDMTRATATMKRKHTNDDEHASTRNSKKTRGEATEPALKRSRKRHAAVESRTPTPLPIINQAPTEALAILVWGNGDAGELGLGPAIQEAGRPRLNPFLDSNDAAALRIVQLAGGGMHTVALAADNKIVTWGVNDNFALGRSTKHSLGRRSARRRRGRRRGYPEPARVDPDCNSDNLFPAGDEICSSRRRG